MSKASIAANSVIYAVEQVLDLYGVQHTREQSRVVNVPDDRRPGGFRPMYFGKWVDDFGEVHASGRADILARPRIAVYTSPLGTELFQSIPLWIECKSGAGRLTHEQRAFQSWVTSNGDVYLLIHDDVTPLIEWLDMRKVKKQPNKIIHAEPMGQIEVDNLACRHCGQPKAQHLNKIAACATPEARGKVWSPKIQNKTKPSTSKA